MYSQIVSSLLVGLGLAFVVNLSFRPLSTISPRLRHMMLGGLFGLAAMFSMMFGSFSLGSGLIGDIRNIHIVLSGLFTGPIGAFVATVLTAIYRFALEGNPTSGIISIIETGIIGALFGIFWRHKIGNIKWHEFFVIGCAITVANIVIPFFAVFNGTMDIQVAWDLVLGLAPVMFVAYSLAIVTIGLMLQNSLVGIQVEKELKDKQAKYESLWGNSNLGYWQIDIGDLTIDVSPAMCKLLGRNKDEILGKCILEFVDKTNAEIIRNAVKSRPLEQKNTFETYEISLIQPDGTSVLCLNSVTPTFNQWGEKTGAIALMFNISNKEQAVVQY